MPDPAPPSAIRHLRLRLAFSAFFLLVFLAPVLAPRLAGDLEFKDYVPLLLVGLPWFGLFVSELKLPGGVEAKFAALQSEVKAADAKAEAARAEAVEVKNETRILAVSPPAPRPGTPYGRAAAELFPPSIRPRPAPLRPLAPQPAPQSNPPTDDPIGDPFAPPAPTLVAPPAADASPFDAPQPAAAPPEATRPPLRIDALSELRRLAGVYATVRAAEPGGPSRTAAMTVVVRDMVAVAEQDPSADGSHLVASGNADEGLRLAAAACAFAQAATSRTLPLVDALEATSHAFVQYWLLVALDKIAAMQGRPAFSKGSRERLAAFAGKLETGSDRHAVLTGLLRKIQPA
jgi:hypothetical protein